MPDASPFFRDLLQSSGPASAFAMRRASPEQEAALPDHVSPMLMPENRSEARLLLLCLETGFLPTCREVPVEEGQKSGGSGGRETQPSVPTNGHEGQ